MSSAVVLNAKEAVAKETLDQDYRALHNKNPGELVNPAQIAPTEAPMMYKSVGKREGTPKAKVQEITATAPHPDWSRLYKDKKPNQHGHILLTEYKKNPSAGGLGYGPSHKTYYQYLSHYNQDIDPSTLTEEEDDGFKPKKCNGNYAGALGYGPAHDQHPWYLAAKTQQDL
jgi:hypothetical protein